VAVERRGIQRDVERLEAEIRERAPHDRLARRLGAEQRRRRDELGEQAGHRRLLGGDRREDLGVHAGEGYEATARTCAGRFQHSAICPSAKRTIAPPWATSSQPAPWLARHVKRVATRSPSATASSSTTDASG
jgi:hypothetical protein